MFLQITDAAGSVRHIDLGEREGEWLLGRSENCDVCLSESSISRKHAKIFGGPETYFIADLGSRIGTANQHGKISAPAEFGLGDSVTIGPFTLRLMKSVQAAPPKPAAGDGKEVSRTFDFDDTNLL